MQKLYAKILNAVGDNADELSISQVVIVTNAVFEELSLIMQTLNACEDWFDKGPGDEQEKQMLAMVRDALGKE